MDKQDNFLVNKFLKQISKIIDHKLEKLTTVESAIVDQVNIDGSVNLHIPPDSTIFTGVQNQSIYQNLKVGDCVKVLKQNNKASNMWIIGGHNLKKDNTVEKINETVSNMIDFIVEQGDSGIWAYRKWNSGVLEMWGHLLNVPLAFSNDNGIYRSTDHVVALPFPITQIKTYGVINANCTGNICAIWVDHVYFSQGNNIGIADDTTPATYIVYNVFQHSGIMDGIVGKFYFSVKGRWK